MEVLRLVISQSQANYKKEETVKNKMTYPLPPLSTVIGAIHAACKFKEYHPMDISIQGKYESMHREAYTDYCFLNNVMDDRGILIKLRNANMLSNAFDKVASAKKSQGNSFRQGITIDVHDEALLKEYRDLKDMRDKITKIKKERLGPFQAKIKSEKEALKEKKKMHEKTTLEYKAITTREKELTELSKKIKTNFTLYEDRKYNIPISRYASLTTSLAYYEVLNNINLIIHVKSDAETLRMIKDSIYNLQSLGRSEDFVEVKEAEMTTVTDNVEGEVSNINSAYISHELVTNEDVMANKERQGINASGTKYHLNKNYVLEGKKRKFEKKKVVYLSNYSIDDESKGIFLDYSPDKTYIVNFI